MAPEAGSIRFMAAALIRAIQAQIEKPLAHEEDSERGFRGRRSGWLAKLKRERAMTFEKGTALHLRNIGRCVKCWAGLEVRSIFFGASSIEYVGTDH